MSKTMLDILRKRLEAVDGLCIKSVKETNTKYTIRFVYEGDESTTELPKSCAPNCHNKIVDSTIFTAMSMIYFNRGDYDNAKKWLEKISG